PIHCDVVIRLIAKEWGYGRISAKVTDQIVGAFAGLPPTQRPLRVGDYFWPRAHHPPLWRGFRYVTDDGATRPLEETPPEEIVNVAAWVVVRAISISQTELVREVAKVFGVKALTAKTSGIIEGLLGGLQTSGRARKNADKWAAV